MTIRSRLQAAMHEGAREGLLEAGAILLERAKAEAPVGDPSVDPHPGRLRESGKVELDPGGKSVRVTFDTPYAAKIHEATHFKHPQGGRSKYLEHPLQELVPHLAEILGGPVRKRMK